MPSSSALASPQPAKSPAAPARPALAFDPKVLPRELARHYIPASDDDLAAMLRAIGLAKLDDLFAHLPPEIRAKPPLPLPAELDYIEVQDRLAAIAARNRATVAFLGDGLPVYRVPAIVADVASIRNLTTAYTPYQPERSQGSLLTHWIYQCLMAQLTGFEAVNSSLYDRASALFEACCCALRLAEKPEADTVLLAGALFPSDIEVLHTHAAETSLKLELVAPDAKTGLMDIPALRVRAEALGPRLAAIAFPQVNSLGLIEDVDALTDLAVSFGARVIAVVDPILFATGGLKPAARWGANARGADILVGEGQHLAIGPNFGGPGLGVFAVRHNQNVRNDVRATPGRFVGKAHDLAGRDCCVMVLSTREQHIRKDKATSNICSNQAFLATLVGAALLERGDDGLAAAVGLGRGRAAAMAEKLQRPGVALAFAAPFFNEPTFEINKPAAEFLDHARRAGIHAGVDVSARVPGGRNLVKLAFTDAQSASDLEKLEQFFDTEFGPRPPRTVAVPAIPASALREGKAGLPRFAHGELVDYYKKLGELNVSPDDACYPLGSCTMKYNPHINDWAASLPGFTNTHPQAPADDAQGCLEILFEIQEWFKGITGLAAVTTQPLAGAQGELAGLKMIQAAHRAHGEAHRNVLLIPKSAHGTNFATAAMAGFVTREENGEPAGIVLLEASPDGRIDLADCEAKIARFGKRLAGIMITNPNTCGLFETEFKRIADDVHAAGGLVYMDGANMNAIAGWANLAAMGVDALHNNLHKTWTIPHGGGGPGDAIVAVSERLKDFLPGHQIEKRGGKFVAVKAPRSIGSFHRHWGNFAHKVRAYAYLLRLGREGVRRMSAVAVLSSRYLYAKLSRAYDSLPAGEGAAAQPRMHEFILTLSPEDFARVTKTGIPPAAVIPRIGKLFLDFGFHAPTVAWPEAFGLMIEPTESYTMAELDRFADAVLAIHRLVREKPEVLKGAPYFTPVDRVDDVAAHRALVLSEHLRALPWIHPNRVSPRELATLPVADIAARVVKAAV